MYIPGKTLTDDLTYSIHSTIYKYYDFAGPSNNIRFNQRKKHGSFVDVDL